MAAGYAKSDQKQHPKIINNQAAATHKKTSE